MHVKTTCTLKTKFTKGDNGMLKHSTRYVKQIVEGEKLITDLGNRFLVISQRPYKGKTNDFGEVITPSGTTFTVQALDDFSDPIINKETGEVMDNNALETFDVTIIGAEYPLPLKKGDYVSLKGFLPELSYYINFNLILRFSDIEKIEN